MDQVNITRLGKRIAKNPLLFICLAIFLVANSGSHPTNGSGGYTAAPGDGVCSQCHGGSNPGLNGDVTIDGVPTSITAGQTYQITVTVSNPNGAANRAGFQLIALNSSNTNAGSMANPTTSSVVKTVGTKKYFGHSPAVPFAGNPITWSIDWTAPASGSGNITFYTGAVIGNGSGSGGDRVVFAQESGSLSGGPTPVTANITGVSNVTCNGGTNGMATVNPSGGSGTYTYQWTSGETTQSAEMLSAGLAKVTVTDNAGSSTVAQTNITQPSILNVNINNQTNPTCFNSSNGSISTSANGGVPGYTYEWSNGATTPSISGLGPDDYILTVTDVNGCEQIRVVALTAPPAIAIGAAFLTDPLCIGQNNGAISLQANGGVGNLSFSWSNGGSGPNLTNLPSGNYTVSITDGNNCQLTESYILDPPTALVFSASAISNVTCNGGNNGSAIAVASGGAGNFSYSWSTGANTPTVNNLIAGTYQVTVYDNNQCSKTSQVVINQPTALIASVTNVTNVLCNGGNSGSVSLGISGGTPNYNVVWNTGATGQNIGNLSSGTYKTTVTDNVGCQKEIETLVTQPDPIVSVTSQVNPILCNNNANGSISTSFIGGTGNLNYAWSNNATTPNINNLSAGMYNLSVTDQNNCQKTASFTLANPPALVVDSVKVTNPLCFGINGLANAFVTGGTGSLANTWSNGQSGFSLSALAGSYNFTTTDANGCSLQNSATITSPAEIVSTATIVNETTAGASNGSISLAVVGGVGTYSYLWSNGATTQNISGLAPGVYSVAIKDGNNCTNNYSYNIQSGGCALAVNFNVTDVTCNGGNNGVVAIAVSNGASPFTITPLPFNLAAGNYNFLVTDAAGCTFTLSNVTVNQPNAISIQVDNVVSAGSSTSANGGINVTTSGGVGSYTFEWKNSTGAVVSTTEDASNLLPGTYTLTVKDGNDCIKLSQGIVVDFTNSSYDLLAGKVKIYPNPTNDFINVLSPIGSTIRLFDYTGKALLTKVSEKEIERIDVNDLKGGFYLLKFTYQNNETVKSFIRQ